MKLIDCNDIYSEEMNRSLTTLKRFREAWLRYPFSQGARLFDYADSDFYFYRFSIERQEKSTVVLLTKIIYRLLKRHNISFKTYENLPYVFSILDNCTNNAYSVSEQYYDDVNTILNDFNFDRIVFIQSLIPGSCDKSLQRENHQFEDNGINCRTVYLSDFFSEYFGDEQYHAFTESLKSYLQSVKEITGYKSIRFLSSMNLASQKIFEEKELSEWDYYNYKYLIIDSSKKENRDLLYLSTFSFDSFVFNNMIQEFKSRKLYRTMLGNSDYAKSFITSELLFHALNKEGYFDYTAVITGFLKSVEQLLRAIVMINVNNNCKITMSNAKKVKKKAIQKNVPTYQLEDGLWVKRKLNYNGYYYIDFVDSQVEYMDSSIGTFEYFLRNNPHIFRDQSLVKPITDMINCFRNECRNGYLHTHNLDDWNIVEYTRNNAIYLYFLILSGCIVPEEKVSQLRPLSKDTLMIYALKSVNFGIIIWSLSLHMRMEAK